MITASTSRGSMILRSIGTLGGALSTLMAGILVVGLFAEPSEQAILWLLVGPLGVLIAAAGTWAWWQGRWGLAAVGMWAATLADIAWFGAVLLPLVLALTATVLAVKNRARPA